MLDRICPPKKLSLECQEEQNKEFRGLYRIHVSMSVDASQHPCAAISRRHYPIPRGHGPLLMYKNPSDAGVQDQSSAILLPNCLPQLFTVPEASGFPCSPVITYWTGWGLLRARGKRKRQRKGRVSKSALTSTAFLPVCLFLSVHPYFSNWRNRDCAQFPPSPPCCSPSPSMPTPGSSWITNGKSLMLLLSPYYWPPHCHHIHMQTSYLNNQLLSSPLNPGNPLGTSLLGVTPKPPFLSMVTVAALVQTHLGLSAFGYHLMATTAFHPKGQYHLITSLLNSLPSCHLIRSRSRPWARHTRSSTLLKPQLLPLLHLQQAAHQPCPHISLLQSMPLQAPELPTPSLSPSLLRPPRLRLPNPYDTIGGHHLYHHTYHIVLLSCLVSVSSLVHGASEVRNSLSTFMVLVLKYMSDTL